MTGADSIEETVNFHIELKTLFAKGGFLLRKWNSSELAIIQSIDPKLLDQQSVHTISEPDLYTKTLGVEWNAKEEHFHLKVAYFSRQEKWTKRTLSSDIAKTYDVLGWFASALIKAKIFLKSL